MSSRDAILSAIRANKPEPLARPSVPFFDADAGPDLVPSFIRAFRAMGGTLLEPTGDDDPLAPVAQKLAGQAVVVSRVPEIDGTHPLDMQAAPASLANVDVAIVRAVFGVAETGSIALTEEELGINTLAYLAQHLIVLLDPADIVSNMHRAYARPEFLSASYTVFHTGPSATADIEGVLIHGAQGVRSLSVLLLKR